MEIKAKPKESIHLLGRGERAMGNFVTLTVPDDAGQTQVDLVADTFWDLYKDVVRADPPPDNREVNVKLLDYLANSPTYRETLAQTRGNLMTSKTTSQVMSELLMTNEALAEALKHQEDAARNEDFAKQQRTHLDALEQMKDSEDEVGFGGDGKVLRQTLEDAAANAEAIVEAARKKAQHAVDWALNDPTSQAEIAAGVKQAKQKADEVAQVMAGYGIGPGDIQVYDIMQENAFHQIMQNPELIEIAKLAGRVRGAALNARQGQVQRGVIIGKVAPVRDLMQVLPGERALLRKDAPALIRAAKVAEFCGTGLLGYEMQNQGQKEGPFVAAVDVSPSMRGQRNVNAKGIALGLALAAKADGRQFVLVAFASDRTNVLAVDSSDNFSNLMLWANHMTGGGTDFDMAIAASIELIERMDAGAEQADLLFISDGEGLVLYPEVWQEYKTKTGARLHYIPVVDGPDAGNMEVTADFTYRLSDVLVTARDVAVKM